MDETRGGLTRTLLKLNAAGERVSMRGYSEREFNSAINLEEAATVAESLVRIQEPSSGANGYYAATKVHGDTPYDRYKHDRKTLVPEKPMRGRSRAISRTPPPPTSVTTDREATPPTTTPRGRPRAISPSRSNPSGR